MVSVLGGQNPAPTTAHLSRCWCGPAGVALIGMPLFAWKNPMTTGTELQDRHAPSAHVAAIRRAIRARQNAAPAGAVLTDFPRAARHALVGVPLAGPGDSGPTGTVLQVLLTLPAGGAPPRTGLEDSPTTRAQTLFRRSLRKAFLARPLFRAVRAPFHTKAHPNLTAFPVTGSVGRIGIPSTIARVLPGELQVNRASADGLRSQFLTADLALLLRFPAETLGLLALDVRFETGATADAPFDCDSAAVRSDANAEALVGVVDLLGPAPRLRG